MIRKKSATRESIPCFLCGFPMRMLDDLTGFCDDCDVMEERKGYASHQRQKSALWWSDLIVYTDHAKENHPSPA